MVTIYDGYVTDNLRFDSLFNEHTCQYTYFYSGKYNISPDKTYSLNVNHNGKTYKAQAQTNLASTPVISTGYVANFKDLYGEHEGVTIGYTDLPGVGNYYRYEMTRRIDSSVKNVAGIKSKCTGGQKYYVKEIGRTIYSDKNVDGQTVNFTFEPTYSHKKNDTAYIRLQSVDKNIYNFYENLDKQKLAQYNPFIEPVFLLPGQFTDAIGVFGAYAISAQVIFIYPE